MKRSGSQESGLLPPPNKRARSTPRESHGGTRRCACNFNEADLCDTVFPVVWSFLLEPSRNDPSSRTSTIDFKSISSFMLVNTSAKEAFDTANGRSLCLEAIKLDFSANKEFVNIYMNRVTHVLQQYDSNQSSSDEEIQQCQSLLEEADLLRFVLSRLALLKNQLLPTASHIAQLHCYSLRSDEADADLAHEYYESTMNILRGLILLNEASRFLEQAGDRMHDDDLDH